MVQLHNALQHATASSDLIFARTTSPASTTSSAPSTSSAADSFAEQLTAAIEGYLSQSGNGSHFEIDVQKGSTNGGFTVTVKNLDSGTSSASVPAAISSAVAANPAMKAPANPPSATPPTTTTPILPAIDKSQMSPEDAYWAEQPAAVQVLRNMPDSDRQAAAVALAQQGYTIDVPIMVWGWDPLTTMMWRQNYGYTWVTSALDAPVQLAPGLSFPGLTPYDANNPPAGSIKVTTDFAKGTNMQNNYVDAATIEATWTD